MLPVTNTSNSGHHGKVAEATLFTVKVILLLLKVRQGDRGRTKVGCWTVGFIALEYGRFADYNNTGDIQIIFYY